MKNQIYHMSSSEIVDLEKNFREDNSVYLAKLQGETIQTKEDYLKEISQIFQFPIPASGFDGYFDWMTDLSWLEKEKYILVITNFKKFMSENSDLKEKVIKDFREDILSFWEEEVKCIVVGGYPKVFEVYLLD